MLRLLLVRHARCAGTGDRLHGRAPGVCLNREGRAQLGPLLSELSAEPVHAVYCSPLDRTRETAAPIAEAFGLEPVPEPAFHEIDFGDWTGRSIADLEQDPAWREYNLLRATTRIPGGELMLEVQARVLTGVQRLQRQHDGRTVLVVTHADVIRALLAHLLGMPLEALPRLDIAPASITEVELYGAWPQVRCVGRVPRPC